MAVCILPYDSPYITPLATADLQQFHEPTAGEYFHEQSPILSSSKQILVQRANAFFKHIEDSASPPKRGKSPLQALLERTLQIPDSEKSQSRLTEITQAFFKQRGYLARFFSQESWEEWTENRTSLGKVVSQFKDCIESQTRISSFTKKLNGRVIQKANEEAEDLLKRLNQQTPDVFFSPSKSSCVKGLIGGTVASLAIKNPLPLLLGLSECFPKAFAQQKVGSEFQITANNCAVCSIASLQEGNFVAVLRKVNQDGMVLGIFGQLFDRCGNKVGKEFQITSMSVVCSTASFPIGNFVVTWYSEGQVDRDTPRGIYGQLFDENGSKFGNEFQVHTYNNTIVNSGKSSVASFPNGNFVVTCYSYDNDNNVVLYGQMFDGNATKLGDEFQVTTYFSYGETNSVITLGNGNFVVTWFSNVPAYRNSRDVVFGQLLDGYGNKIGSEFQVNPNTTSVELSSAASFLNGNFVVIYYHSSNNGTIFGQLFDETASKVGSEFIVNTYPINTNNMFGVPSVASLGNGDFVVAWDTLSMIHGQLFDYNGNKTSNEFQINTNTLAVQGWPSVANLGIRDFVVEWFSSNSAKKIRDDSNIAASFGQIFFDNTTSSSNTSTSPNYQTTSQTSPPSVPCSSTIVTSSNSSNQRNRFLWLWLLLGGTVGATCLGVAGYFIYKNRSKKDSTGLAFGDGEVTQGLLGESGSK